MLTTLLQDPATLLLPKVHSPEDIRDFSLPELNQLAQEIRDTIIHTVSRTGGHLAPSLGVVELTIALHYVFNTPDDKLIWDVGHQSYAHKLLTGRVEQFASLRQYKGMSGFPKFKESIYDAFETGHSSTSISAALGMTVGKSLGQNGNKAIAIIGDGSMTAGMAFEALNHAGHLNKDLIVILNDNEMSISPNVGALSSFLSRKLTGKTMRRVKNHIEERLTALSNVGENILSVLKKSEESFKSFFTPGMLFEAFKFDYIGPIMGHDYEELIPALRNARDNSHGPTLIHILTTKGKGYEPAEKNPGLYHGVGPFDIETGTPHSSNGSPSYTSIFGNTLCDMAENDERITAISAAMVTGTGLAGFAKKYPNRFFDVGIAEQHAVTFAAGMATEGLRPVVAIYSTFLQRAMDQILHDVCIPNLPVTFAIDRAGVVGDDGPTHHGVFDISFLRYIPNIVLMAPKDEDELRHMLYTAVNYNGPTAVRYPRGSGENVVMKKELQLLEIGRGELLAEGDDVLLLPVGNRVYPALNAAAKLKEMGFQAAVINPRFIKPLDANLILEWAQRTDRVVTIEDGAIAGGFGSSILELLATRGLHTVRTRTLGYADGFVEHGPQRTLWKNGGIDVPAIVRAALQIMDKDPNIYL
ncbi:1-deoxy-D-xylulose-5-phosphate synthase [Desulfopila aestuarii]|uniref:1-deoxy-D-xylulose-5-phosphate synthase n=1 Tax=Desulfopila aestuarii DSM 18488 TaxID=1121416 RepID=A0A1M7YCV8_9BACT|nr:1-deoxy-D-xylulose-5-phosphate synthase [Desulfopila aestuarii]SHO50467.1 1-deoxy-D-xylulose-5-phosphate synthase [Desulfopila aestuarii DSM 18488]